MQVKLVLSADTVVNPLPDYKISALSKLKLHAYYTIKATQNSEVVSQSRKQSGKRTKCW